MILHDAFVQSVLVLDSVVVAMVVRSTPVGNKQNPQKHGRNPICSNETYSCGGCWLNVLRIFSWAVMFSHFLSLSVPCDQLKDAEHALNTLKWTYTHRKTTTAIVWKNDLQTKIVTNCFATATCTISTDSRTICKLNSTIARYYCMKP